MNESPNPKTIPEQLRELRDAQQVEVDRLTEQLERAKEELKRLNKALKQWEAMGTKGMKTILWYFIGLTLKNGNKTARVQAIKFAHWLHNTHAFN